MARLRDPTSETGPRNRPLRSQGYDLPPAGGRRHRDWRHNLFMDDVGCLMILFVVAPAVYFLGMLFRWW